MLLIDADFFVALLLDDVVVYDDTTFKHYLEMFNSFVEFSSDIMYSDGPNDHDAETMASTMTVDDEDDWNKHTRISFSPDDFSMSRRAFRRITLDFPLSLTEIVMFVTPKPMSGKGLCAFFAENSASSIRFSVADVSMMCLSIVHLVNVPLSSSIGSRIEDLESISV